MYIVNQHGCVNQWPDGWDIPSGQRKATAKEVEEDRKRREKQTAKAMARVGGGPNAKSTERGK